MHIEVGAYVWSGTEWKKAEAGSGGAGKVYAGTHAIDVDNSTNVIDLKDDAVTSEHIKNETIKGEDIGANQVPLDKFDNSGEKNYVLKSTGNGGDPVWMPLSGFGGGNGVGAFNGYDTGVLERRYGASVVFTVPAGTRFKILLGDLNRTRYRFKSGELIAYHGNDIPAVRQCYENLAEIKENKIGLENLAIQTYVSVTDVICL